MAAVLMGKKHWIFTSQTAVVRTSMFIRVQGRRIHERYPLPLNFNGDQVFFTFYTTLLWGKRAIFSKVLRLSFCSHLLPLRGQPYLTIRLRA